MPPAVSAAVYWKFCGGRNKFSNDYKYIISSNAGDNSVIIYKLDEETGLLSKIYNARLNSSSNNRVPNTTNIGFEYVEGELILLNMDEYGICASSGSACTSGSLDPSHVLKAMGVPFTSLHGSIRFSLSRYTTEEEIDYTIEKMPQIIEKVTSISPFQKELKELRERKGFI